MQIEPPRVETILRWLLFVAINLLALIVRPEDAAATNQVRFCAKFNVSYWDDVADQDVLVGSPLPANKHWAEVQREGVTVGTPGYMVNNCTPFTSITPGRYTLWVTTAVAVTANKIVTVFPDTSEQYQWYSSSVGVITNPAGDSTFTFTFDAGEDAHVSLIASVMGSAELVNGTYKVYANQGCGSLGLSCFDASVPAVFLGTIEQTGNDAFSKSVVAHEIGHFVQNRLFGTWNRTYGTNATQDLCVCDHVDDPNDRSHCMQSREQTGAARLEGWGHAYAAILYNNPSHTVAAIGYYKNFLSAPGDIPDDIMVPPVWLSATTNYTWMERHCLASNRGTEMDWMSFFYWLHRRSSTPLSFADLKSLFEQECGGTCNSNDVVTWTTLNNAAVAKFGAGSNKAKHVSDSGDAFGVNH